MSQEFFLLVNGTPKCRSEAVAFANWGDDESPRCGHPTQESAERDAEIIRKHLAGARVEIEKGECPDSK